MKVKNKKMQISPQLREGRQIRKIFFKGVVLIISVFSDKSTTSTKQEILRSLYASTTESHEDDSSKKRQHKDESQEETLVLGLKKTQPKSFQ
jgi:hypothetical protein